MFRTEEQSASGFAMGVVTGAFVGAGLALLFAPKTGVALREELGESMTTVRDAVAQRYRDLAANAGVDLDNLQERVAQVAETVESGARELVESAAREGARRAGSSSRG